MNDSQAIQLTAKSLTRIADTLDDYMEMSLATQAILSSLNNLQNADPQLAELYKPLIAALDTIRANRKLRHYE